MTLPRFRPVAERALLVELEGTDAVRRLDAALTARPFPGLAEAVPATDSLLVLFDPLASDHDAVEAALRALLAVAAAAPPEGRTHTVPVCYDPPFAPDLPEVARRTGLPPEEVIAAHLSGRYRVAMYGFAPGYAYLSGVPAALHLPRKPVALRDVPAGSVIIAGAQCIVTTLTMPTGWWIIGRSPARIVTGDPARPFLFDPGDRIRFRRVPAADLG